LTTIGRHPDSAICLDDVTVSRRHAQVSLDNGRYVVRDLGSLNGTYVNQMRIDELALEQGDELQIGKYRMVFFNG
jgi:pSer/pThr/pTyr-binding forkhead associated (FHA) protein